MTQATDIKKTEAFSAQSTVSRLLHTLADMILIIGLALGALLAALFGIGDGLLILLVVFYSSLIFVIGLRDFAAMLLGVTTGQHEPPWWLTPAKSSIVVAAFLSLLLGAASAICMLVVSGQVRVVLLVVIVVSLWAVMRCVGRRFPTEKSAGRHGNDS